MPIDEKARLYMREMRMLDRDHEGREKLVGLTAEESEWYLDYQSDHDGVNRSRADRTRYLELQGKHERHRISIIMAENEARVIPVRN